MQVFRYICNAMIITTDIQLFQILKQKIGEAEAEALVSFVDAKLKESNEANLKIVATKEDISLVKQDIIKLETKIAETKADMIKWMFSFFVAMMLAIIGLYFKH
jgi:hypothetical protein